MGKDKTVAAAPVATAVKDSEDSVMDEIKGKNIMPTNLAKEVQDDIAKEEEEPVEASNSACYIQELLCTS